MRQAVIIDAVRSPIVRGKPDGQFSTLHPVDLLAQVLAGLVERTGINPLELDDVIGGCASQGGEQAFNLTRSAVLGARLPVSVPATTIDRQCGSSQQAADFGAQAVMAGAYDLVIACGVESMSRVPMWSATQGKDVVGAGYERRYPEGPVPMGISAELIAARWGLTREQLDEFALRSHQLAAAAAREGRLDSQILPIQVPANGEGPVTVEADDGIRADASIERMASLGPAFVDELYAERFPEICWLVSAASASQISDGAGAVLIASQEKAEELGLKPRARFVSFAVAGDDPMMNLTAVIPATRKALARAGLRIDDIDVFEVNEAFSPVVLAWQDELGAAPDRVNVNGGAIAIGHPLGASGARLMTSLVNALEQRGGRFGLQTMCEAGGLSNATIIERL